MCQVQPASVAPVPPMPATLAVVRPVDGLVFQAGALVSIRWTVSGYVGHVCGLFVLDERHVSLMFLMALLFHSVLLIC